jgi:hypothetical protein
LPVSTVEWTASLSIAELPVIAAATYLLTAIARLPASAARMVLTEEAWLSTAR